MDLWIRSQDRETLLTVSNIFIDNDYQPKGLYRILDNGLELGRYKTKERALEVLDEIHQRLIDLQTLEIAPDFRSTTRSMECVYEMSQE